MYCLNVYLLRNFAPEPDISEHRINYMKPRGVTLIVDSLRGNKSSKGQAYHI